MDDTQRLAAFERMLADVTRNYETITARLETLKSEGKTKTATFRQYLGEKMTCQYIISLYQTYGLFDPNNREVNP